MTEEAPAKAATAPNGDAAAGVPFYEKQRQQLKELISKKKALDKKIVSKDLSQAQVPGTRCC